MRIRERYAELHCHSSFSLLDGASNPEELVACASQIGLSALALTDHDDLGGLPRFSRAAQEASLTAIVGAELTLIDGSHLILLCENLEGYKNLSALISLARMSSERGLPRVTYEDLFARSAGLLALSGCQHGVIPSSLAKMDEEFAKRKLGEFLEVFGDRFFLEVWNHYLHQEALLVRQLIEMAGQFHVPWVVTNNVHYATREKRIIHDVLCCLRHDCTLATAGRRLRPNGSWYMKSPEEVALLWRNNLTGVRNTLAVAERCQFRLGFLEPPLPPFVLDQLVAEAYEVVPAHSSGVAFNQLAEATSLNAQLDSDLPVSQRESRCPLGGASAGPLSLTESLELRELSDLPEDTEFCESSDLSEDAEFRESSDLSDDAKFCESSDLSEDAELRELSDSSEDAEFCESSDLSEDTEFREFSDLSDDAKLRELSDSSEPSELLLESEFPQTRPMPCTAEGAAAGERVLIQLGERLVPSGFSCDEFLRKLVYEGAAKRYENFTDKHKEQIEHELKLILRLKMAAYFLIMWDIVRFAGSCNIFVQGRGSAANSVVCYCLQITAVDPIAGELLFERFLSEGRKEPPDIDLDIAHQKREIVLQYVYRKYGREHAAMVCEVISYRGRSAVRDAARVLGFSNEQADLLASEAHHGEALEAAHSLEAGGLERLGFDPADRKVRLLLKIVAGLHQLPRHRSIHVGGFVLSALPIGQIVPVEPAAMAGRTVIQWDKDDLDIVGLIKIDLLGLGMLTMLQEAVALVRHCRGIELDLAKLNMSDPAVYKMLQAADTVGVFQVESRAQMNILPKLVPRCFYDLVVSIAIVRPGPIQGNIIHPYLRRRRGEEEVSYLHPSLEPILKRTLGVPLFQEQGMKLAVVAAGFTASQADQLRKVMSHKRSLEKMAKLCDDLAAGMARNGFSPDAIATMTHQLQAFASYGFPESHAASFALLVYASAYIKYYFPSEFYCAILNAQPMGFYSPASLIRDAQAHGVEILPVDLARSQWNCTLVAPGGEKENSSASSALAPAAATPFAVSSVPASAAATPFAASSVPASAAATPFAASSVPASAAATSFVALSTTSITSSSSSSSSSSSPPLRPLLQLGLRFVHGLGPKARTNLERALREGPFLSLEDVVARSNLTAAELKLLAAAGAFRSFCSERRSVYWQLLRALKPKPKMPLLEALTGMAQLEEEPLCLSPLDDYGEMISDYHSMGLSTGRHPMDFYRAKATTQGMLCARRLKELQSGREIKVAGVVICRQRPATAKGFTFLTLEDETGMINIVVKPQLYEQFSSVIKRASCLIVTGILQQEQGVVNIIASGIEKLVLGPGNTDSLIQSHDFH